MKNPLGFLFSREETDEHLPNREILSYAAGLTGQNISYSFISSRLTYFYENHAVSQQSASKVGKLMTYTYLWDAVNDVIVGAYVDKRPHKPYQKMRPYLLYFPAVIGILCALMFIKAGSGDIFKLIYLGVLYFIWDLLYSFQDVGLWGLLALSSPHSHERSRVAQWVTIGAAAGGTIAGAFPFLWDVLKGSAGMKESTIFTVFAFIFGLGGEMLSLRAAKFRERVDSPVQKDEKIWESLSIVRHNPTLIFISLARFSQGLSPKINQTYFFQSEYRNSSSALLKGGTAEVLYGIVSGFPGAIALPFANKIIDRVGGMKRLLLISQIAAIVTRLIAFGVGSIPALKYSTPVGFVVMCLLVAVHNIPGGLMDIAHRSLTSDSIDEVELKTGIRSEGVSFSMQNFTTKLTSGVSTRIQNFFLYNVLGYIAYDDENYIAMQGEKFYKWQYPLFMLGPIVGAVLYIVFISFVKDNKQHRAEVERLLKERRAAVAETAEN
ncbi:MAG: MFS transporter [Oscillospiraceae bacterium]|nr:MFS transporter [Oscillospiraceae bacterium]